MIPQPVNTSKASLLESQTIRAAAAIAYIYADYLKANPLETQLLPPENASYEECIKFYQNNQKASESLLTWFKENVDPTQEWLQETKKWYQITNSSLQARKDNYLERWKEVTKEEIKSKLTVENILALGGTGKASRIFNDNPIEEVLCPHEIRGIIDDFLPNVTKRGDAEAVSHETVRKLAGALQARFIDSEVLDEIIDEYKQNNPDEFQNLLLVAYVTPKPEPIAQELGESDEIYQARLNEYQKNLAEYEHAAKNIVDRSDEYTEILKKDLMSSLLQPLGNYIEKGENGEEKASRQIAYNALFKSILQLNLEQQLRGGEALTKAGNNDILEGEKLSKQPEKQRKGQALIEKGNNLIEKKDKLIIIGALSEKGRPLKESIAQIQQHPKKFEFIGSNETSKQDYIEVLFMHNGIDKLPEAFVPKKISQFNQILQSIDSAINSILSGIKNLFSSTNEQQNKPASEVEIPEVEARKISENDAVTHVVEATAISNSVPEIPQAEAKEISQADAKKIPVARTSFVIPKHHVNEENQEILSKHRHSEPDISVAKEIQKDQIQESTVTTRQTIH